MSEVYIRSQNREKLYRLGGDYVCVEYASVERANCEDLKGKRDGAARQTERHMVCISNGFPEEIGEYGSKERCVEILDEIQKICRQYLYADGLFAGGTVAPPMAAEIPRVYEMPKE